MHVAILTFDGFNEIDSIVAFSILGRLSNKQWRVSIASPTQSVTSMSGLKIDAHCSLSEISTADAVIIGSGINTRSVAHDPQIISALTLDPARQLIAAQCSGTYLLAKLGLLKSVPACTDSSSKPWVRDAGVEVLDQAFYASGNIATAGGCLASQYLVAWLVARREGTQVAEQLLHYVAPVGEKPEYVARAMKNIERYL